MPAQRSRVAKLDTKTEGEWCGGLGQVAMFVTVELGAFWEKTICVRMK
jgi:hypothetical protein